MKIFLLQFDRSKVVSSIYKVDKIKVDILMYTLDGCEGGRGRKGGGDVRMR